MDLIEIYSYGFRNIKGPNFSGRKYCTVFILNRVLKDPQKMDFRSDPDP